LASSRFELGLLFRLARLLFFFFALPYCLSGKETQSGSDFKLTHDHLLKSLGMLLGFDYTYCLA
jgi:hypothetical protein